MHTKGYSAPETKASLDQASSLKYISLNTVMAPSDMRQSASIMRLMM